MIFHIIKQKGEIMINKIIKRDGTLQYFELEKIGRSIKSSARDCKHIINESDIKLICNFAVAKGSLCRD